jgi:hypothetical protein
MKGFSYTEQYIADGEQHINTLPPCKSMAKKANFGI